MNYTNRPMKKYPSPASNPYPYLTPSSILNDKRNPIGTLPPCLDQKLTYSHPANQLPCILLIPHFALQENDSNSCYEQLLYRSVRNPSLSPRSPKRSLVKVDKPPTWRVQRCPWWTGQIACLLTSKMPNTYWIRRRCY